MSAGISYGPSVLRGGKFVRVLEVEFWNFSHLATISISGASADSVPVRRQWSPSGLKAGAPSPQQKYCARIHPRSKARGFLRRGLKRKSLSCARRTLGAIFLLPKGMQRRFFSPDHKIAGRTRSGGIASCPTPERIVPIKLHYPRNPPGWSWHGNVHG